MKFSTVNFLMSHSLNQEFYDNKYSQNNALNNNLLTKHDGIFSAV